MKDWVIVYIDGNNLSAETYAAYDIITAIQQSALPLESIVSVQCVNTEASP